MYTSFKNFKSYKYGSKQDVVSSTQNSAKGIELQMFTIQKQGSVQVYASHEM